VHLFTPARATRVRWNTYTDTPVTPDEPAGQNPPDGAILDYWLEQGATGPVTLEILDAAGKLVRRYSSEDTASAPADEGNVPWYWIRPTRVLPKTAGMHRFVWDLHHAPPAALDFEYPISAVIHETWKEPRGMWAMPGRYTVRLTANGATLTRPLTVRMDPRVKTPFAGLEQQFALSSELYEGMRRASDALDAVRARRKQVSAGSDDDRALAALEGAEGGRFARRGGSGDSFASLNRELASLYQTVQGADAPPTAQTVVAARERLQALEGALARWRGMKK
jgi:hypothetical protein